MSTCKKCRDLQITHQQIYQWVDETDQYCYVFDVDQGYVLAKEQQLELFALSDEQIPEVLRYNEIESDHIEHVVWHWNRPGLAGTVAAGTHLLLDGAHRAAYCLKYHKPFTFYVLDPEQTNSLRVSALEQLINPPGKLAVLFRREV